MIIVGFWKILGVYFLYIGDFCISGLTTVCSLYASGFSLNLKV